MKRSTLSLLVLLLAGLFIPKTGLAQASPACPASSDGLTRGAVLVRIGDARIRSDFGLTAVDTTHLRALADPGDTTVCQRFRSTVNYSPDWTTTDMEWSYYAADGFYFVAGVPTRVGAGYGLLLIYDSSFNRKAAILL
jgi:hypothetical protein